MMSPRDHLFNATCEHCKVFCIHERMEVAIPSFFPVFPGFSYFPVLFTGNRRQSVISPSATTLHLILGASRSENTSDAAACLLARLCCCLQHQDALLLRFRSLLASSCVVGCLPGRCYCSSWCVLRGFRAYTIGGNCPVWFNDRFD